MNGYRSSNLVRQGGSIAPSGNIIAFYSTEFAGMLQTQIQYLCFWPRKVGEHFNNVARRQIGAWGWFASSFVCTATVGNPFYPDGSARSFVSDDVTPPRPQDGAALLGPCENCLLYDRVSF